MDRRQFIKGIVAAGAVAPLLPAIGSEKKDSPDVILHRDVPYGVMTSWPTPQRYSIPPLDKRIPVASEVLLWDRIPSPYLPTYDIPQNRNVNSFFSIPKRGVAELNGWCGGAGRQYSITIPWITDEESGEPRDATLVRLLKAASHSSVCGPYKNLAGLMDEAMRTLKHYGSHSGFRPKNVLINTATWSNFVPWFCSQDIPDLVVMGSKHCPNNCIFLLAEPEWVGVYATLMTNDGTKELPQWAMGVINAHAIVKVEMERLE